MKQSSCVYPECGTAVAECTSCSVESGTIKCDMCADDKVPATDKLSCTGKLIQAFYIPSEK